MYQTQNAALRSQVADSANRINGSVVQPTTAVAPTDVSLGGAGNTDAAARIALLNGVGSAKADALRTYLGAQTQNTNSLLGGQADAQNARGLEYARQMQAQRPMMMQQMQQYAIDNALRQAQTYGIINTLGTKQEALDLQRQHNADQSGYWSGLLNNSALNRTSRENIAASNNSTKSNIAGARLQSDAAKYGIKLQGSQGAQINKILGGLITRTGSSTTKDASGNATTKYSYDLGPNPFDTTFGQISRVTGNGAQAALLTTRALAPYASQVPILQNANRYYSYMKNTLGPAQALTLTKAQFGQSYNPTIGAGLAALGAIGSRFGTGK